MADGFELDDYVDELADVIVWPENHEIFILFSSLQTQWAAVSVGMSSLVYLGMRYEAVYPRLDRMCKDSDEWEENLYLLQEMERASLPLRNQPATKPA